MLYFTKHNIKNPTYFFMSNLSNINSSQAKNGSWQEKLKNQFANNPKIKTAILLGIGIVIGLASCNFYQKKHPPIVVIHRQPSIFSPFWFHDNYYQVQDEIYEQLNNYQNLAKKPAQAHNFSANLTQKQDDNFHYYTLSFSGLNPQDIIVKTNNAELLFTANNNQQNENSSVNSSLYYSTSLPENYLNPEIIKNNQEIVVKFKKPAIVTKIKAKIPKNNAESQPKTANQ